MMWEWEEGSVLYRYGAYTPPRQIFEAVCGELGRYYTKAGKTYTKAGRKIKWKGKNIKCEIGLWSSHRNMPGKWINLEVVANVWALDARYTERKGILDFPVREELAPTGSVNTAVIHIDGHRTERPAEDGCDAVVIYGNNCNLWGIDEKLFADIVRYIDRVADKAVLMETKEGMDAFLHMLPLKAALKFKSSPNNILYYESL